MRAATRLKMSSARRGRQHSQESKDRMSAAQRARHALWRAHAVQAAAEQQELGQARPDLPGRFAGRKRRAVDPHEGLNELALEQAVSELIGLRREVRCSCCIARPVLSKEGGAADGAECEVRGWLLMLPSWWTCTSQWVARIWLLMAGAVCWLSTANAASQVQRSHGLLSVNASQ